MTVWGYIVGTIGVVGLFTWFGTRKKLKSEGTWHTQKAGALIWLVIWIVLIIVGLALRG
jgi:hypothetical protein